MSWHFAEPYKTEKYGDLVASNLSQKIQIYLHQGRYTLFIDDHNMASIFTNTLKSRYKGDFDKWIEDVFNKDVDKIENTEIMIEQTKKKIENLKALWQLTGRA